MPKFQLVLLLHAHQPVGNFDDVIERAYQDAYLPFIDVLSQHPAIRLGLHYSGPLLEWAERAHPEYFDKLKALVQNSQVEMVGGGFYEPVLAVIPPCDQREQIKRLADYIEKHFGARPSGAWLTERVWEPQLPSSLAQAGVGYTLVDDNHFLGAGFEIEQLHGYFVAEDLGHTVNLLPGLKTLRYTIPFRQPGETTAFLHEAAGNHPGGFAAMGDDLEKLGSWPETHKHCYDEGWLRDFFVALEGSAGWLETATPAAAIAARPAQGRADLPTASYTEMMEWSLPTRARIRYHDLVREFQSRPEALPFLRGGTWRNFFSKYSEANLLHAKMLHVSNEVQTMPRGRTKDESDASAGDEAMTSLLRGECNDPYWHGVFGGLYMPHLRTAVWKSLARAEALADARSHRKTDYTDVERLDFDSDGNEEVYLTSDRYTALVQPSDGATISALDFRKTNMPLINSLMRRPEAYHEAVRNLKANALDGVAASIHEQVRAKEDGLAQWLHYDRWRRNSFRVLLFSTDKSFADYAPIRLDEDAALAGGRYRVSRVSRRNVELVSEDSQDWSVTKAFSFTRTDEGFEVECGVKLARTGPGAVTVQVAVELVVNFLAPASTDRYFDANGERFPLRWSAATRANPLRVVDEWEKTGVAIEAPDAEFWIAPIETVSESEAGFERIYQGSQIAAVWPVALVSGGEWRREVALRAFQVT